MTEVTFETLITNLDNTINGKEFLMAKFLRDAEISTDYVNRHVFSTTAKFIEVNLVELRNILDHVIALKKNLNG